MVHGNTAYTSKNDEEIVCLFRKPIAFTSKAEMASKLLQEEYLHGIS